MRKYRNESEPTAPDAAALKKEKTSKQIAARIDKLTASEKRWLRKLKLATTKVKKVRAAMRRLIKRKESLE